MLEQLDQDLYVARCDNAFFGLQFGVRTTVVRLADNQLWVHSPIPLSENLLAEIEALGQVRYLVAPNLFHHLWIGDWAERLPQAKLYGTPGLSKKRSDLTFDGHLGTETPQEWEDHLQILPLAGAPALGEFVFFHRPTQTLICADLVLNIHEPGNWFTRLYLRFSGILGKVGVSKIIKVVVKNKQEARTSVDAMLATNFQRLIMAHGEVLSSGGSQALRAAYSWL